jgi:3'-phosphoadenosine 5'-phosphosulfate sulfotransferase (PAPS reductase)/FAD synthetase
MALRLAEIAPRPYRYLCTPTGNELPAMIDHWKRLEELLGQEIEQVAHRTLFGLIMEQNMIPNFRARFCTRVLKIEAFKGWLLSHLPAVGYIGLRADEAGREGVVYKEEEIQAGLTQRYPLSEWGWGLKDVIEYLRQHKIDIPPRTDCALCFFQRLGEWWNLWRDHPNEFDKGVVVEEQMGHTFRSPGRDRWPTALKDLRNKFEAGFVPGGSSVQPDLFQNRDRIAEAKCRMCSI